MTRNVSKASTMRLPNGTFLYPLKYQSINAARNGTPPDLFVVLDCTTSENEIEVERIHCETYDQADAFGRVFFEGMSKYFPQVTVFFKEHGESR